MSTLKEHLAIILEALLDFRSWYTDEEFEIDTKQVKRIDNAIKFIKQQQHEE